MTSTATRRSRIPGTASIVDVLILFDGPQLVFLKSDHNLPIFAVAVEKAGMDQPFFACQVKESTAYNYFEGRADLRYTFLRSVGHTYYFFDLSTAANGTVKLTRIPTEEARKESYWPA